MVRRVGMVLFGGFKIQLLIHTIRILKSVFGSKICKIQYLDPVLKITNCVLRIPRVGIKLHSHHLKREPTLGHIAILLVFGILSICPSCPLFLFFP